MLLFAMPFVSGFWFHTNFDLFSGSWKKGLFHSRSFTLNHFPHAILCNIESRGPVSCSSALNCHFQSQHPIWWPFRFQLDHFNPAPWYDKVPGNAAERWPESLGLAVSRESHRKLPALVLVLAHPWPLQLFGEWTKQMKDLHPPL